MLLQQLLSGICAVGAGSDLYTAKVCHLNMIYRRTFDDILSEILIDSGKHFRSLSLYFGLSI